MQAIGNYHNMPSRTEIRQLYANSKAEEASAAAVEGDKAAAAVVDDVNSVFYSLRRLDQTGKDSNEERGFVSIDATPNTRTGFQKFFGLNQTPVDEIAERNAEKGDTVSNVSGTMEGNELDVTVSFEGDKAPMIYSRVEDDQGNVFFQRGNETVGMNADGLLFMGQV